MYSSKKMELFGFALNDGVIFALLICIFFYLYLTWNYDYFEKCGVKTDPPLLLLGNMHTRYYKKYVSEADQECYKRLGKVHGMYEGRNPVLVVGDPDKLKLLFVKQFNNFSDKRFLAFFNGAKEPVVSRFLTSLQGEVWKAARYALTPAFTSGKLKQMGQLMEVCIQRVIDLTEIEIGAETSANLDMRMFCGLYIIDVVASCAFGSTIKSLSSEDPFYRYGSNLLGQEISVQTLLTLAYPNLARHLKLEVLPLDAFEYYENIARGVIEQRRKFNLSRPDFLQLLLEAQDKENEESKQDGPSNNSESKKKVIDENTIIAQIMTFFLTGLDTAGACLTYVIYLLAIHPEYQDKLYNELQKLAEPDGKLNHETAQQCEYLDMVLSETLRMYPIAHRIDRRCTTDCTLGDIPIKKGMHIVVPVYAMHFDETNFKDPNRFNPERFSPENKSSINPYAYLPFGVGPRTCIAMRFSLIKCKIAIAYFVYKYKFSACSRTEIPIPVVKSLNVSVPKGKLIVNVERRISIKMHKSM